MRNLSILIILGMFCASALPAAELGERIRELKFTYLANEPENFGFDLESKDPAAPGRLVLVDFFGTSWPSGPEQGEILNALTEQYRGANLTVIAASGEPRAKLERYIAAAPKLLYAVAYDPNNMTAQRVIPGDLILPVCVIVDGRSRLLWAGDTSEAPGALARIYDGSYDMDKRIDLLPYYSQLAAAMRGGAPNEIRNLTDRMLALEPGNITAAQARLFLHESTGDLDGGWKFLGGRCAATPDEALWYWLAVGYGARNPGYRAEALKLLGRYPAVDSNRLETINMAWEIINNYEFSTAALDAAEKLLGTVAAPEWRERAALALLAYKRCDLAGALKLQREAVAMAEAAKVGSDQLAELGRAREYFNDLAASGNPE